MITSRNSTVVDMLFREFYSSPNFIHASLSLTLALSSLITTYSHKSAIEESARTHLFVNHWPVGLSLAITLSPSLSFTLSSLSLLFYFPFEWYIDGWVWVVIFIFGNCYWLEFILCLVWYLLFTWWLVT